MKLMCAQCGNEGNFSIIRNVDVEDIFDSFGKPVKANVLQKRVSHVCCCVCKSTAVTDEDERTDVNGSQDEYPELFKYPYAENTDHEHVTCAICGDHGAWGGSTVQTGATMYKCEECDTQFCSVCAAEKGVSLTGEQVLCPECAAEDGGAAI